MGVKLREKTLKDGRISLYLDIYHKGTRSYEFLELYYSKDTKNRSEILQLANKIKAEREIEIYGNPYGHIPRVKSKQDFIQYYEQKLKDKNYKSVVRHIKAFANENKKRSLQLAALNNKFFEEFAEYLLENVEQNTAWMYLSKIKAVLKIAVKEKLIPENYAAGVKIKKLDVEKIYLTLDELNTLATTECRNQNVKDAFLLACYTGLRFSDLKKLRWDEIYLHEEKIKFRQKKTKSFEYLDLGPTPIKILKNQSSSKIIPLTSELADKIDKNKFEDLQKYLDINVFKFPTNTTVNTILREWAAEAKIDKKVTFHSSRHTFAVLSLQSGVDIFTVSKLLGHTNIETTLVYAKITDITRREAVKKLPDLNYFDAN